ncbi:MAG: beta-ketoacyl-[acyl-carrier-protein] synthase family protein [Acidobacteriaceae bacterium]
MRKRAVITGLGVVSPNGIGVPAFENAILQGKSGVRRISLFDPTGLPVTIAGEVSGFDEMAWISEHERKHVSRAVPLAFAAATEALADSGWNPEAMSLEQKRDTAVILGTGGGAQDFSEGQYRLWLTGNVKQASIFVIPSGTMGTMSSEISMRFGFRGFSHVVTCGCTSSTDALGYAVDKIRAGSIPRVLVGGVDSPIALGIMKGFLLMRILSTAFDREPEKASRPFSLDRDGFVLAEGAWMLMLEEYETAKARGARIYAEIVGYGSTCEAFHRVRLQECGEEPARAMQLAMRDAAIGPEQVEYVNLHGTSTELNDRIETRAIKLAMGEQRAHAIPMSALKSQIGHPQGACGAAGVIATILAMKNSQLPPTINLELPDPECDLDYVPEPGREHAIEYALCNCIAFGSKNSALVLKNGFAGGE